MNVDRAGRRFAGLGIIGPKAESGELMAPGESRDDGPGDATATMIRVGPQGERHKKQQPAALVNTPNRRAAAHVMPDSKIRDVKRANVPTVWYSSVAKVGSAAANRCCCSRLRASSARCGIKERGYEGIVNT